MLRILASLIILCAPLAAMSDSLSDTDIDRYLAVLPDTAVPMDKLQDRLKNGDEAIADKITKASMTGKGLRTMLEIASDSDEVAELNAIALTAGYDSADDWALVGDRIGGVMFAANWVVITSRMPIPNSPEPDIDEGANLFEYFEDTTKSAELQQQYKEQLTKLCTEYCFDVNDIAVVGPRYNDITSVFESIE